MATYLEQLFCFFHFVTCHCSFHLFFFFPIYIFCFFAFNFRDMGLLGYMYEIIDCFFLHYMHYFHMSVVPFFIYLLPASWNSEELVKGYKDLPIFFENVDLKFTS